MTNNYHIKFAICLLFSAFAFQSFGHINPDRGKKTNDYNVQLERRMEDCTEATAQVDQNVNNVRARLTTGGDVWWDPQATDGRYVVPAVPIGSGLEEVSSIFAAAVWLGGFDPAGGLKVAATDYRNAGNTDFYPGPLDDQTGLTDLPICQQWDRFFEVEGDDVAKAIRDYERAIANGETYEIDSIPEDVLFWPGNDNPHFRDKFPFDLPSTSAGLGAYWDEDQNGIYDPVFGDFPIIEIRGCEAVDRNQAKELVPDEMIFWIYNDAGGPHSLTRGSAINMEVQVQSFAYATNDEINDMTFQRYKLINRATTDIRDTYFGWWVDPDLGCFEDDYSGCDVSRSLAYTYNEDALDGLPGTTECGEVATYKDQIPIIGTDYFRGPLGPHNIVPCPNGEEHVIGIADEAFDESLYSIGDTICIIPVDPESLEEPDIKIELGMSSFIYYNNPGVGDNEPQTEDPANAEAFYSYLTGSWNDGTPLTVGGNGFNPGSVETTLFAFPDPPNDPTGWSMATEALPFGDRRTVQASGPFLLKPGDRNELIIGAVWVPDVPHPNPAITKLQAADDIAQNLFDACFDIVDGPDAPDMCTVELDREIILILTNDSIESNNAFEAYEELDILSSKNIPEEDRMFKFEGYKIYQLANQSVSPSELDDIEKAILVRQVDVENGVASIYNWESSPDPNPLSTDFFWTPTLEVDGADLGIQHTFRITQDAFANGDTRLVNHETYHFMVVAYAYNNFETFSQSNATETQQNPYLEGRGNIRVYSATPRPIIYQGLNAQFGDGVPITRIQGVGVGNNVVDMDPSMYEEILSGSSNGEILYRDGAGPIEIKIYNPLEVRDGVFQLEMEGEFSGGLQCGFDPGVTWTLRDVNTGFEVASEQTIDALNEQLIPEYGFSVAIGQAIDAGLTTSPNNGALSATISYENVDSSFWFSAIRDDGAGIDGIGALAAGFNFLKTRPAEVDELADPNQSFSSLGDGFFYPFMLCSGEPSTPQDLLPFYVTPAWKISNSHSQIRNRNGVEFDIARLNNVDIVFTDDKSLWSKCIVVETASEDYLAVGNTVGNADMFDLRQSPSIDQDGNEIGGVGFSYFPGYAINVETGKRLNIFFGENSLYEQGQDMIYNPTDEIIQAQRGGFSVADIFLGGGHFIYVCEEEYDECAERGAKLAPGNLFAKLDGLKGITWASMSLTSPGTQMLSLADGLVPNDATIKLRVANPYNLETRFQLQNPDACFLASESGEQEFPIYQFEILNKGTVDLTQDEYEGALSNVNVVPNPYYAYSEYETGKFDKAVQITNLPDRAEVTIYSLDGKFIRRFDRDEMPNPIGGSNPGKTFSQTNPSITWNLENYAGIPIASGVYLIHVYAPDLQEERTLKWFGINRKFDASGL